MDPVPTVVSRHVPFIRPYTVAPRRRDLRRVRDPPAIRAPVARRVRLRRPHLHHPCKPARPCRQHHRNTPRREGGVAMIGFCTPSISLALKALLLDGIDPRGAEMRPWYERDGIFLPIKYCKPSRWPVPATRKASKQLRKNAYARVPNSKQPTRRSPFSKPSSPTSSVAFSDRKVKS